jgi:sulfoxide reductase heme-binding subunit YedZ
MFDLTYLDISAGMGLCATLLLSFNFLLGMMLSTAYKRSAYWQKLPVALKRISIDDLHNWTAYVALLFVLLHPLFLLMDTGSKFSVSDILLPLHAPKQANIVLLGILSMYALIVVIITTQKAIKRRMGFRTWKNIHLISYGTALLFIFHGLLMDPELKDRPTDWLDAEKFLSEFCLLVLIIAGVMRYRYHVKSKAPGKIKVNE